MGYESRIFIVERHEHKMPSGANWVFAEKIAVINMCKMGYDNGFHELFSTPIDYKIFIDGDTETDTDCYGEHMKYAKPDDVIRWLKRAIKKDGYRRMPVLLGLLNGFKEGQWADLQVVHYGY